MSPANLNKSVKLAVTVAQSLAKEHHNDKIIRIVLPDKKITNGLKGTGAESALYKFCINRIAQVKDSKINSHFHRLKGLEKS